jgi:hypothetical protein
MTLGRKPARYPTGNGDTVEVYPDGGGLWRWRRRAANHRIVADGGGLDRGVQAVLGGTVAWHSEIDPAPARSSPTATPTCPTSATSPPWTGPPSSPWTC